MDYRAYVQQPRFWFQEFLVELLGAFVPGLIFTFLATIVVGYPLVKLYGLYEHVAKDIRKPASSTDSQTTSDMGKSPGPNASSQNSATGEKQGTFLETYKSLSEVFGTEIAILFIAVSFAVGSVFLRADLELPDVRSVWANRRMLIDVESPAVYFRPEVKNDPRFMFRTFRNVIGSFLATWPGYARQLEREGMLDVHFPYRNLKKYLEHRNFSHLAEMIPWKADDEGSWRFQTKQFVNVIKVRLGFALPDKCNSITRNEAHVRLMSSVWYMARLVQRLALLSMGLILVILIVHLHAGALGGLLLEPEDPTPCVGCLVLIIVAMFYIRHRIEMTLHSQRLREIVCLLETAHFAKVCATVIPQDSKEKTYPEIVRDLGEKNDSGPNGPRPA